MFMSNKVSKTKTDQQAMSASGLPRNEKSTVRDDILAAAKTVKSKKAGIGAVAAIGAAKAEARERREKAAYDKVVSDRRASVIKHNKGQAEAYRMRPKTNTPQASPRGQIPR